MKSIIFDSYKELFSHVINQDQTIQLDTDIYRVGYLITIPYWAQERKSIQEIIKLFSIDAFEGNIRQDLMLNIAMVIGVNQKEHETLIPQLDGVVPPFAVKVISFNWKGDKPNLGDINNFIKESHAAQELISKLRQNGCADIYYAKFDADTVALNKCFSNYEDQIQTHYKIHSTLPTIVTSGYITKHNKPEEHGFEIGTHMDYLCRMSEARHLPFSPYVTEANALILLPRNKDYLEESYSATCEMAGMIKDIHKKRKLDPYKSFLFVDDCPIITEYRPTLIAEIKFRGEFKRGKYSGFGYKDIKNLRRIWQTHYFDGYKIGQFQDDLKLVFPGLEYYDYAYQARFKAFDIKSIGGCIEFVIQHINRLFDPVTITYYKLPTYIRQRLDKDSLSLDMEYIKSLGNVVNRYQNYVGWRKPFEQGPSQYVVDGGSNGITIILEKEQDDYKLSDLGNFLYLKQLQEKLSWLLTMYVVKAKDKPDKATIDEIFFNSFYEKSSYFTWLYREDINEFNMLVTDYNQDVDGTISILRIVPRTFREAIAKIAKKYNDEFACTIQSQIDKYVELTMASAHEKGLAAAKYLSEKLLLDNNKIIPYTLRHLTIISIGEEAVLKSEEQNSWTNLHEEIFNNIDSGFPLSKYLEVGRYGCNALHILALTDNPKILKLILHCLSKTFPDQKKQLLEAKNDADKTPLELAFFLNKAEQVAIFIDFGANFLSITQKRDSRTLENECLLHIVAAYGSHSSILQVLPHLPLMTKDESEMLERGEQVDIRNLRNNCGETPLHVFLSKGRTNFNAFKQLLTNDNFDLEDEDGFTPLVLASQWDKSQMRAISAALVLKGANSTYRCIHAEHSPLEQTIENYDLQLLSLMLEKGANINKFKFLLHNPYVTFNPVLLKLLTKYLNKKTLHKMLNLLDHQGNAPIHIAIIYKHTSVIRLLLDSGTNINIKNHKGVTPLELAKQSKAIEAIHILRVYCTSNFLIKSSLPNSLTAYDCTKYHRNKPKLTENIVTSPYLAEASHTAFVDTKTQFYINRDKATKSSMIFRSFESEKFTVLNINKIVYSNAILNHPHITQIFKLAYQLGGTISVNQIINLGLDADRYIEFMRNIELSGIASAVTRELFTSHNINLGVSRDNSLLQEDVITDTSIQPFHLTSDKFSSIITNEYIICSKILIKDFSYISYTLNIFQGLINNLFVQLDIPWKVKQIIYYYEITQFYTILRNNDIYRSIDVLRDASDFRKSILLKLHPDKGGNAQDFVFVKELYEKLNVKEILDEQLQSTQSIIHEASIGFKVLDAVIDTTRLINEPNFANTKKLAFDFSYLYGMYFGLNALSLAINGADSLYHCYQGEYNQAFTQIITTVSYMFIPAVISFVAIPYVGFMYGSALTIFSGYSAANNAYLFYQEYNSAEWQLKSVIAYKDISVFLANSPLQQVYDFAADNKQYEIKINAISLEIEKSQTKQQLETKGEFGTKLYNYIYMPMLEKNILS